MMSVTHAREQKASIEDSLTGDDLQYLLPSAQEERVTSYILSATLSLCLAFVNYYLLSFISFPDSKMNTTSPKLSRFFQYAAVALNVNTVVTSGYLSISQIDGSPSKEIQELNQKPHILLRFGAKPRLDGLLQRFWLLSWYLGLGATCYELVTYVWLRESITVATFTTAVVAYSALPFFVMFP